MGANTAVADNSDAQQRIAELSARLEEAEETLRAVRAGEIDAFIVQGPRGEQVYSLHSVEQPYRTLVEEMQEGAAILTVAGDISEWAGQTVTLSLANTVAPFAESFGVIDDIAFSPQVVAVPEPSGMGLLAATISLSVVFVNRKKVN